MTLNLIGVARARGGSGSVTTVTASSPLQSSGGATPNISILLSTGSGSIVLATSPTLTTPVISGDMTLSGAPGKIKPAVNSTTALQIAQADGTVFASFDTTNKRFRFGDATAPGTIPYQLVADLGIAGGADVQAPIGVFQRNTGNVAGVQLGYLIRSGGVEAGGSVQSVLATAGGSRHLFLGTPSFPTAVYISDAAGNIVLGGTPLTAATERLNVAGAVALSGGAGLDTPNSSFPKIVGGVAYLSAFSSDLMLIGRSSSGGVGIVTGATGGFANVVLGVHYTQKVHIGAYHLPATRLSVLELDSATNAITTVQTLGHDSSGTPAAGFGGELDLRLKSSTTVNRQAAYLDWLWNTATEAGAIADVVLGAIYNPSGSPTKREGLRIRGGSADAQIGFYSVTPISRAVLATGVGATVDNVITALQNLGLVKQA